MKIHTIGFTGKTAEEFFGLLNSTNAKFLADIRLNNRSQLAGFTKKGNIEYFVDKLTRMSYLEMPIFAPAKEMFGEYRKNGNWDLYESRYLELIERRAVIESIERDLFYGGVVLLCSERTAEKCHRRLVAEYIQANVFPESEIIHLH